MKFNAYSLLEILVVLTIIGILMAVGMANYSRIQSSAMKQAATTEMKQYGIAISSFKMDNDRLPENLQELLDGGYITKSLAKDPWNQDYKVEPNEQTGGIRIISGGTDKKTGTKDDIILEETL